MTDFSSAIPSHSTSEEKAMKVLKADDLTKPSSIESIDGLVAIAGEEELAATNTVTPADKVEGEMEVMNGPEPSALELSKAEADIRILHAEMTAAVAVGLAHAIAVGRILTPIRSEMPYGNWKKWVDTHLPIDQRMAQKCIQLFRNQELLAKCAPGAHLTINGACKVVADAEKKAKAAAQTDGSNEGGKSGATDSQPPQEREAPKAALEEVIVALLTPAAAAQVLVFLRSLDRTEANFQVLRAEGTIQMLNQGLQQKLNPYLQPPETL